MRDANIEHVYHGIPFVSSVIKLLDILILINIIVVSTHSGLAMSD